MTDLHVSPLAALQPGVELGTGSVVEEFCLIGRLADQHKREINTVIGDNSVLRSHTVIYAGNRIGSGFVTGHHVLIRENNIIGNDVSVGSGSIIEHDVVIGDRVRIHSGVFIPEYSVLEDDCWIGPRVVLTNVPYPQCPDVGSCIRGVRVGSGAKVGANATILPGVRIGKGSLVGSGAIVARDVPAYSVVTCDPARVRKSTADLTCPAGRDHMPYPAPG